jgi:multidrug efflux pump subunit AcrA (membrane-fusion protein)
LSSFVATLATANARIASLEAELKASQKTYDAATAAKAIAEKSQKSAIVKAKKAEKALADANKEHAQQEQAVAERLHTISSAAESKIFDLSLYFRLLLHSCTYCHLSLLFFSISAEFTGVSSSALPTDDDPLMDAVNLLEEN